jgi:hypothetical protein
LLPQRQSWLFVSSQALALAEHLSHLFYLPNNQYKLSVTKKRKGESKTENKHVIEDNGCAKFGKACLQDYLLANQNLLVLPAMSPTLDF